MHIHIVARHEGDVAWPGTVWSVSKSLREAYSTETAENIKMAFRNHISKRLSLPQG